MYDSEKFNSQHCDIVFFIEHHSDNPVFEALREKRQVLYERRVAVQTDQRLQTFHAHFSYLGKHVLSFILCNSFNKSNSLLRF